MKEKSRNTTGIIIGIVAVLLVVAIVGGLLYYFLRQEESKASAIMQLETNPGIALVLDQNNIVIAEVALSDNEDGEEMLSLVSFVGMNAEDAAKKFAETAAKMDKMNDSFEGTTTTKATEVRITISAEDVSKYQQLADSAKSVVNEYFKENGIIARAVNDVNDKINEALSAWAVDARDYANLSTEELLNYAKTSADELRQVAITRRNELATEFNDLYNEKVAEFEARLNEIKQELDSNENVPQVVRDAYHSALRAYNEAKTRLNEEYDSFVKSIQEQSESYFNNLKAEAEAAYQSTIEEYNNRVQEFKDKSADDIEAILEIIAQYQAQVESAN